MAETTKTIESTLQQFCSSEGESARYGLQHQQVVEGWRYATDSRILVRVQTLETGVEWDVERQGRRVRCEELFKGNVDVLFKAKEAFAPLKPLPNCEVCENSGYILVDCEKCGGMGDRECLHCEHTNQCNSCGGSGTDSAQCTKCEPLKLTKKWEIDQKYVYLMQMLPHLTIKHFPDGTKSDHSQSLFSFMIEGCPGQGIIMHRKIV